MPAASPIRLRVATIGHREVASSRLRVYRMLDRYSDDILVRSRWVQTDVSFRLSARLSQWRLNGVAGRIVRGAVCRIVRLEALIRLWFVIAWLVVTVRADELLLLQKITLSEALLRHLRGRVGRLVYDFDDAIFTMSRKAAERTRAAVQMSDVVITSTPANADWVLAQGGSPATVLTPVDTDALRPCAVRPPGVLRVGWIGSPSTTKYLEDILPALESVARVAPVEYIFIGARRFPHRLPSVRFLPWSDDTERRILPVLDVGLMPLRDDPWSAGKGGYKVLQYMACGVPTLASGVGPGPLLVVPGVTGHLVDAGADWTEPLLSLLRDEESRARMRRESRALAMQRYSVDANAELWREALLAHRGRTPRVSLTIPGAQLP